MSNLKELIDGTDDEELLIKVMEELTTREGFDILEACEAHRNVVAVVTAQAVIDNGGFRYFFESHLDSGADYNMIVSAYNRIGASESADAIDQALKFFPGGVPSIEIDEKGKQLDTLFGASSEHSEKISEIENKVLGKFENYHMVADYIRQNKDMFV